MCGISGVASSKKLDNINFILNEMNESLNHRGPDDNGVFNYQNYVAMGHKRLSIIDLSSNSKQPVVSKCKRFVMSFNGMIYNYKELSKNIKCDNIISNSDTLVLIEHISKYGLEKTLNEINGMFAIALFDIKLQKIYLARDRFGKKPLYYEIVEDTLFFSSEIKSILKVKKQKNINKKMLINYFHFGYSTGNQTFYEGINQVGPGKFLERDIKKETTKIKQYWNFFNNGGYSKSREKLNINKIENLLFESIKLRLRSDVSTGIFLSGGVDSGVITALASKVTQKKLNTYTVIFDNKKYSEREDALEVAKKYNTNHTEIKLSSDNMISLFPKIYEIFDEPTADPSIFPSLAISSEASNYCKVILNGEGADEIFGGYRRLLSLKYEDNFNFILKLLPKKILENFFNKFTHRSKSYYLKRFFEGYYEKDIIRKYLVLTEGFNLEFIEKNQTEIFLEKDVSSILNNNLRKIDLFRFLDIYFGMSSSLLKKVDMTSMNSSLEVRCPFLDKNLAEYLLQFDTNILLKNFTNKFYLKKISEKYLPKKNISKPKQGFEIPIQTWVYDKLFDFIKDTLNTNNSMIYDFFDKRYVDNILSKKNMSHDNAKKVWVLLMYRLWEI
tara:strand:+ start:1013 stop:2851 length:1839 start_codon:yes stop_codon:yes gene_type:complete